MIDAKCGTFSWHGTNLTSKRALVAWEQICLLEHMGGLGLKNIMIWNKFAIMKQLWNIATKMDSLWIAWVHETILRAIVNLVQSTT